MKVTLVSHTPDPLYVCAQAASICYASEPSLNIVKGCIKSGHTSVLEHASFTFKIEGISRSCSHQIVRHRIASYSQESQRYVVPEVEPEWVTQYLPSDFKKSVNWFCHNTFNTYKDFVNFTQADNARCILPNATPTKICVTMNIRALMNFFNERLCSRASEEIRTVAKEMIKQILATEDIDEEQKDIFKTIFVPKCEKYSLQFCPEIKGCGRRPSLKQFKYVPKANWEPVIGGIQCSSCGSTFDSQFSDYSFHFCPHCGAEIIE